MSVQARFYVASLSKTTSGYGAVNLTPSTRGKMNSQWSFYTPSGNFTMNVRQDSAAFAWFEERLGKDIAITFEDRDFEELDPGSAQYDSNGAPKDL